MDFGRDITKKQVEFLLNIFLCTYTALFLQQ